VRGVIRRVTPMGSKQPNFPLPQRLKTIIGGELTQRVDDQKVGYLGLATDSQQRSYTPFTRSSKHRANIKQASWNPALGSNVGLGLGS